MSDLPLNHALRGLNLRDPYEQLEPSVLAGDVAEAALDFSLNTNPLGPPRSSVHAALDTLEEARAYPHTHLPALRRAVSDAHGIPEDHILFGAGLDEVIKLLVHAWTNEGDRVAVPVPTFPRYELEVQARGAQALCIRGATPWEIPLSELRRTLKNESIGMAMLSMPSNPVGATLDLDELEALVVRWPTTQFVIDEALIYPEESGATGLVTGYRNVAVLRTFSKYFGLAGLRIGYVLADAERLQSVEVIRPPFNVSTVGAVAARAALSDIEFLRSSREYFACEREAFRARIERGIGWTVHSGDSNLIVLELDMPADVVIAHLAANGIRVVDCADYVGLEASDALRISLRTSEENRQLVNVLEGVLVA